jgi:hypothetical protein
VSDEQRGDEIAARARRHLDRTSAELDTVTVARLRAARLRALDGRVTPREPSRQRRLALAGAGAFGVLAALSWWLRAPRGNHLLAESFEDVEILADADDLEIYDDDVEFYRWLDETEPI